jgi:hypothetical protein
MCLRRLGQWVSLDYRFDFYLCYEIKGFVEILGAVLLAANHPNALRDDNVRPELSEIGPVCN